MSDAPSYVFSEAQLQRMRAAEDVFDEGTKRVLAALPFDRHGVALEVGAGGGSIARWLCEVQEADGQVVAADIDTAPLDRPDNPPNLTVMCHNIVDDPLLGSYDLIHARLLLEHLPQRDDVLDKLARALRPGGWLVIEDVDYTGAVGVSELGREVHELVQSVRLAEFARIGIDHYYGRRLPAALRAEGLEQVGHDGRITLMEGGSPSARWLKLSLMHLRGRLVETGHLTDEDLDQVIELLDQPEFAAFGPVMIAAWGRRP